MKTFFSIKKTVYLILITSIISFLLSFILFKVVKLEQKIENKMLSISTQDIISIVNNSANSIKDILKKDESYIKQIENSKQLQEQIEKKIEILITSNIKYSYLLYKDSSGVFRFLADGDKNNQKAFLNQKFDIDSQEWIDIYENKEPLIIEHKYLQELSISYLYPILNDKNDLELILAIDFSVKKVKEINELMVLIKNSIISIIIVIVVILLILIYQTVRYLAMKKNVFIDKLTNVYNRNYLQEFQNKMKLDEFVLAVLDIDHFKKINDTYGHDVGDEILRELASIIKMSTRDNEDVIIRYGGEEFVILTKMKNNEPKIALTTIERIFKNIQKHKFYYTKNEYLNITASIGVNLFPGKSKSFLEAFKLADISLYKGKNEGRNNLQIHEDISSIRS